MKVIGSDLKGKKILITGASGGLGSVMAHVFASYDACIGLHYCHDQKRALLLQKEISKKTSAKIELFKGDLLEQKVRTNLVVDFVKVFGKIDILINNAGAVGEYKDFFELSEETWDETFALNVKAPFYLMGSAFEYMKKSDGGRIINISSVNVKYGGSSKSLHYIASKAALESLHRGLVREGAKYNILINAIRCGLIDTPMRTRISGYSKKNFQKRMRLVPLQRAGSPLDIARMALFLASESGNFITGEIFTVAGGD